MGNAEQAFRIAFGENLSSQGKERNAYSLYKQASNDLCLLNSKRPYQARGFYLHDNSRLQW